MQALDPNEGRTTERGGAGGETSNFSGSNRDSGYVQIFGVWGRDRDAELSNDGGPNWEDVMELINADLRENYNTSLDTLAPLHIAGQQQHNSAAYKGDQIWGIQIGGLQNGGGGKSSTGPKRAGTPRKRSAKKQRLSEGTF